MSGNKKFAPSIDPPSIEAVYLKGTHYNPGALSISGNTGAAPNRIRASSDGQLVLATKDGSTVIYPSSMLGFDIIGGSYHSIEAGSTCSAVICSWNT